MRTALIWIGIAALSMIILPGFGPLIVFTVWLTLHFTQKNRTK